MSDLITTIATLAAVYFVGTKVIEKKHYISIREREKKFLSLPAVTAKNILEENKKIKDAHMVCGSVVISVDYFKKFLAGLRKIFGGEVASYEPVLDRARREAILRMKESAKDADIIINMRIETSTIGGASGKQKSTECSEVLAYGTAVTFTGSASKKVKSADTESADAEHRSEQPLSAGSAGSLSPKTYAQALPAKTVNLFSTNNKQTKNPSLIDKLPPSFTDSIKQFLFNFKKTTGAQKSGSFEYLSLIIGIIVLLFFTLLALKT